MVVMAVVLVVLVLVVPVQLVAMYTMCLQPTKRVQTLASRHAVGRH
jgi:hypothetical protein